MPQALPISFFYFLFSTIFCIRQFRDSWWCLVLEVYTCYSVASSVSVSLETVVSIPLVLGAGNLLAILLLVIE
jgi:hypothetical protein